MYWRASPNEVVPYATAREPAVLPGAKRKQVWVPVVPVGRWTEIKAEDKAEEVRKRARAIISRIEAGQPAFEPEPVKPETLAEVCEDWLKRHVVEKKLRSEKAIRYRLEKFLIPAFGKDEFASIRRLTKLLDHVQDHVQDKNHGARLGARTADQILSDFIGLAKFYAGRHDHYQSPVIKGMRRDHGDGRDHVLTDDEIRIIWHAAERPEAGAFGAIVRLGLLTLQRRDKLISMKWDDVVDGVWHIPQAPREKPNGGSLKLPQMALDIVAQQRRLGSNPYIFPAYRGNGHFVAAGVLKRAFDKLSPPGAVRSWRVHDLRRSGRTLMSREGAGIDRDIAERVMGHMVGSKVERQYDRHKYDAQKAEALAKLAKLIANILDPPPAATNVVELDERRAAAI